MMALVIALLLSLILVVFVGFPFFRKAPYGLIPDLTEQDRQEQLEEEKHQAFESIRDLEFEYQMGKLSSDDYQGLRKAAIEKSISIIKASKFEKEQPKKLPETNYCPNCGKQVGPDDRFCRVCGKKL